MRFKTYIDETISTSLRGSIGTKANSKGMPLANKGTTTNKKKIVVVPTFDKDKKKKKRSVDEILALAGVFGGNSWDKSPDIQSELGMLFSKVNDAIKKIKSMTGASDKKVIKKAVEVVIKKERLNKNWTKLLKKYVKKYS